MGGVGVPDMRNEAAQKQSNVPPLKMATIEKIDPEKFIVHQGQPREYSPKSASRNM